MYRLWTAAEEILTEETAEEEIPADATAAEEILTDVILIVEILTEEIPTEEIPKKSDRRQKRRISGFAACFFREVYKK